MEDGEEGSGIPDVSGFTLSGSLNAARATSLVSGNGTSKLVLQLNGSASVGETITLSYDGVKLTTKSNAYPLPRFYLANFGVFVRLL